jgi:hypothetical protein
MPENTGGDRPYSDEELDRRLAELTSELAGEAKFKEKSAAERAAAADKAQRRAQRKAGRQSQRTASWEGRRGPDRGDHARLKAAGILAALAVVVGGGLFGWLHVSSPGSRADGNDAQAVRNGPVPPAALTSPAGPPANPFAGSPANGYADGQAGIAIPAAHRVGGYSATQVRHAYGDVKKLLVASQLDPTTLAGGAPDAYAKLLIAPQRTFFIRNLDKTGLTKRGDARSTRNWVAAFAPGTTRFIGHTVKVHGTMSARTATVSGTKVLRIDVSELFVYPVAAPHQPADWLRVVGHDQGYVDFGHYTRPAGALQPYVALFPSFSGDLCGINDGYVHPSFPRGAPSKVQPSGAPVNPYSLATAPPSRGCRQTTGT